jgi:hypothetical protein
MLERKIRIYTAQKENTIATRDNVMYVTTTRALGRPLGG